jgi:hypothetical protein
MCAEDKVGAVRLNARLCGLNPGAWFRWTNRSAVSQRGVILPMKTSKVPRHIPTGWRCRFQYFASIISAISVSTSARSDVDSHLPIAVTGCLVGRRVTRLATPSALRRKIFRHFPAAAVFLTAISVSVCTRRTWASKAYSLHFDSSCGPASGSCGMRGPIVLSCRLEPFQMVGPKAHARRSGMKTARSEAQPEAPAVESRCILLLTPPFETAPIDSDPALRGNALWLAHALMASYHQDACDRLTGVRPQARQTMRLEGLTAAARLSLSLRMRTWPTNYKGRRWIDVSTC